MPLLLRNPHSVLAALQTRPADVTEVRLAPGTPSPRWAEVAELARSHGIPIRTNLSSPDRRMATGAKSERMGAASALVHERSELLVDELFVEDHLKQPGLFLALEQLQDPHNVGAIFRTAAFFGVKGIITTRERSAPLSATVYDVASGGLEYVPFAVVPNLSRTILLAKEAAVRVIGASEHGPMDITEIVKPDPFGRGKQSCLLILGNEEHGLRRVTGENCDALCRLTPAGPIQSLNVSVAAGVFMATLSGRTQSSFPTEG